MNNGSCIFCKIAKREIHSKIIWQDDCHIATLTPYPNTPGFTVIFTKEHLSSYIFDIDETKYFKLMNAARLVGKYLDLKLGTKRCGLIAEGMGIDHAHIKLIPMHGIQDGDWKKMESKKYLYNEEYQGYLSSHDGPLMDEAKL